MFTTFGNPRRLITDAGAAFTSKVFKEFVESKGIKLFTTAVGLPRGNGQCERTNKTILDALATTGANIQKNNWDIYVPQVQQGINSTKHRITQHTPAELFFGFQLHTDNDKHNLSEDDSILDVTQIRSDTTKRLEDNRIKQDAKYNERRCPSKTFQVGDLVLTKVTSFPANNESKKLLPKFRGPFKIIEVLPNDRYRVQEDKFTGRSRRPYEATVGLEHLKAFTFQRR